jgi:membrane associated rhomboid family serine protease
VLFLPIGHDQTIRRFPWLTVAIMALCVLLQLYRNVSEPSLAREIDSAMVERDRLTNLVEQRTVEQEDDGDQYTPPPPLSPTHPDVVALERAKQRVRDLEQRALVPRFGYRPKSGASINLLLAAFVHGGWIHLAGNLLFLWLCGCNLEDRWGRIAFGGVYVVSAIVASIGYAIAHPGSDVPLIGASGAIAGAMGAFLVCYSTAQIKYWWWWGFRSGTLYLPAYVAFPVWFLAQLGQSLLEVSGYDGIAYSAHVGGFVCGAAAALGIRFSGLEAKLREDEEDDEPIAKPPPRLVAAPVLPPVVRSVPPPVIDLETVPEPAPWPPPIIPSDDPQPIDVTELQPFHTIPFEAPLDETQRYILLAEQNRWHDALSLYDSMSDKVLSDRAYSIVVRAAVETNNLKRVVEIAQKLANHHPTSPLLPRAVWDVANAQERGGRADLARKSFSMLIERFPNHRFAEESRKRLT